MNVFGKKKVYADEQNERYIARGKEEERGEVEKQERRRGRKQRSQELQELLGQQEAAAAAPAQQDNALETTSVSQTLLHSTLLLSQASFTQAMQRNTQKQISRKYKNDLALISRTIRDTRFYLQELQKGQIQIDLTICSATKNRFSQLLL